MKKRFALLLVLCLALFLCACSSATDRWHFIQKNGVEYEVDTEAQTISDETSLYSYTFTDNGTSYSITVTYPNGSSYTLSQSGWTGTGSHSKDYNPILYADGEILCDILADIYTGQHASETGFSGKKLVLVFFLGIAGIFLIASPHTAWYLSHGWHYKDAEPSEASLTWNRISGGICILLAIIVCFMSL